MSRKALRNIVLVVGLSIAFVPMGVRAQPTLRQGFMPSWDGTLIRYSLFLPEGAGDNPVPVVLRTHGWGGTGETSASGMVAALLEKNYAVLTWDQRGFGQSGGRVEIDHPDWEGRDVMSLIDFAASQPEILKSGGDPVVGMSGGSYAGGIQLIAASIDPRINAIVPEIAWNDLPRAIFPNGVPKFGWDSLLYGAGQTALTGGLQRGETGNYNPEIHRSFAQVTATNDPSPFFEFFDQRSPKHYIDRVTAPTLIIQGTIDTLFSITEGVNNFEQIRDNELGGNPVPTELLFYNSGHTVGSSIPARDASERASRATIAWFDRYLRGLPADTGPLVEYQDNLGDWHSSDVWPIGDDVIVTASVGNLVVSPAPAGGGDIVKGNPNVSQGSARVNVITADGDGTAIVGVPRLSGRVTGTGLGAFLFFKLVNAGTNQVLGDQVTALSVDLSKRPFSFDIQLEGVSHLLKPGERLVLEVSTGSAMYSGYRGAALVGIDLVLSLPVS